MPRSQFKLLQRIQSADKLPWMLRLYTRGDDEKLRASFNMCRATLRWKPAKLHKGSLALYKQVDTFKPRPDAKVAIWYGSREPNMKKAVQKIKRAFPNAEEHPFEGYGHGDIIGFPDVMAEQIERFMSQNVR